MGRSSGCNHRIRKSYPFGKKSTPRMNCKDCGAIITPMQKAQERRERERKAHFQRRRGR